MTGSPPPALTEGLDLPLYVTYWIRIETVLVSGSIGAGMHTAATFGILLAELKKNAHPVIQDKYIFLLTCPIDKGPGKSFSN